MDIYDSISNLSGIGPSYEKKLNKLAIETIYDLIHHVPTRYIDFSKTVNISSTQIGDIVTVKGEITDLKNQYTRNGRKIQIVKIQDKTGTIIAVWFNQPFLIKTFSKLNTLSIAGEVGFFGREKAIIAPEYELFNSNKQNIHTGRLIPIYHETKGISSKWLRSKIQTALSSYSKELHEFLRSEELDKLDLMGIKDAISLVHYPKDNVDAFRAKERLSFNELLFLQLKSRLRKIEWRKQSMQKSWSIDYKKLNEFIKKLPFNLTDAQNKVLSEFLDDFNKDYPMNRLLEGDVGSGKTVLAAIASYVAYLNHKKTYLLAPTQILATQHYQTFKDLLSKYDIKISLITSKKKILDPKSDIYIGTHSLLNLKTKDNLGLVIIDEQHKFGVKQRSKLLSKSNKNSHIPHLLTMTATPIPRTIALTAYGDLDLSVLDELPKGRKKITTWIVPKHKRANAYKWIEDKIKKERIQVFLVCPLIEESESELLKQTKAVKSEFEKIKKIFKNQKVGLLHGKLKIQEKDTVMDKFRNHKLDILVSTPVIEVGVDIKNANIMIVETADRFGLAQLHQLRGRIGRGNKKSYCLLFSESNSEKALMRLSALESENNGFKLSEIDLKLRGPGEIFGFKQSGFPLLRIASWSDEALIKKATDYAKDIIENKKDILSDIKKHLDSQNLLN